MIDIAREGGIGGNNWDANANPSSVNLQTWDGVTCACRNGESRVVDIQFNTATQSEVTYDGVLSQSVGNLTFLESIQTFNSLNPPTRLDGPIPSSLRNLDSLKVLRLSSHNFNNGIPSFIGEITTLVELSLFGNPLGGNIPSNLGNLTNLEQINFGRCRLIGSIPSSLGNLTNLVFFSFFDNGLSGQFPSSIWSLRNLESLDVRLNRRIEGEIGREVGGMRNLTFLGLFRNSFSGEIPRELGLCFALETIYLHENNFEGCLSTSLNKFCDLPDGQVEVEDNENLSWGGDWQRFCNNETQPGTSCSGSNLVVVEDCSCIEAFDVDGDSYFDYEDCDDNNPNINPEAREIPNNNVDEDCDGIALIIDEDRDGFNSSVDCDDNNPRVYPGATEILDNGIDEDCDGVDATTLVDLDGDGFFSDVDCNDGNASINPGAAEVCNGIDENCNGSIDEGLPVTQYFQDLDNDGFGNTSVTITNCNRPLGFVALSGDCNDNNAQINPGATEIPGNGIDENCDGIDPPAIVDLDGDGFFSDVDCDDNNASVNPGATEACNGIDENCNGQIDEGLTVIRYFRDADNDGYGNPTVSLTDCRQPSGYVELSGDCNDNAASINPGATDIPGNGIDEDCDGMDAPMLVDSDGDGFLSDVDCNDGDPSINPGATEACNGIDENCNGSVDEGLPVQRFYEDLDGDGYGNTSVSLLLCGQMPGFVPQFGDCNDANSTINPGATEIPGNGVDEDCNGTDTAAIVDSDGDGFFSDVDCNDGDPSINPGATEACNGIDENCNGEVDEGLPVETYFRDFDDDGFGDMSNSMTDCSQPDGYVLNGEDCDDFRASVNPDAVEVIANGIDEDCDGEDLLEITLPLVLENIDTVYSSLSTGNIIFEDNVTPIIGGTNCIDGRRNTHAVVTEFGQGRVAAFGSFGPIGDFSIRTFDNANFVRKLTQWLEVNGNTRFLFLTGIERSRLSEFQTVNNEYSNVVPAPPLVPSDLENVSILVVTSRYMNSDEISADEVQTILDFVENGGSVLMTGDPSSIPNGVEEDYPNNQIASNFGFSWTTDFVLELDNQLNFTPFFVNFFPIDDIDCDGDGFLSADDCNDDDASINPDATDIPNNGIDEDCDGVDEVSSATHELANSTISIYPNPAVDVITVDVQGSITVMATLYDFSGRKVLSSEMSQINVNHVPPGVYLLEVKDVNSGQQIIERIVIGR